MVDYREMYLTLFRRANKAVEVLQKAMLDTEEMYISAEEPEIRLVGELRGLSDPNNIDTDTEETNENGDAE